MLFNLLVSALLAAPSSGGSVQSEIPTPTSAAGHDFATWIDDASGSGAFTAGVANVSAPSVAAVTVADVAGGATAAGTQAPTATESKNQMANGVGATSSPTESKLSSYRVAAANAQDATTAPVADVRYVGPVVISKGGVYSGNWESQIPSVPVVLINTTEPVIIQNCRLRGRGNLISAVRDSTTVTIRDCIGESLNPNLLNARKGRFAVFWKPVSVIIENNTMLSTAGVYVNNGNNPTRTIRVRYNRARNIDGRISDGKGGYLANDFIAQFVQVNNVKASPDVEIAWNEVINEPRESRVEDNINLYLASGTPESPIRVHNNYIQGAFPLDPASSKFSGGGIIVDGAAEVLADAAGYISIFDNQVVATSNHGISIAAGHHVDVRGNRAVSSGLLGDGSRVGAANVGLYAWNYYKTTGTVFSNVITDNVVGWVNSKGSINNWWFPDCPSSSCFGNRSIAGPITVAKEAEEYLLWQDKVKQRGLTLGSSLKP